MQGYSRTLAMFQPYCPKNIFTSGLQYDNEDIQGQLPKMGSVSTELRFTYNYAVTYLWGSEDLMQPSLP